MTKLERLKRRKRKLDEQIKNELNKDYYGFDDLLQLSNLSVDGIKYRLYRDKDRAKKYGAEMIGGNWVVSKDNFDKYWTDKCPEKSQERV